MFLDSSLCLLLYTPFGNTETNYYFNKLVILCGLIVNYIVLRNF